MYKAIVSALLCLSVLGSGAATARTDYESRLTHEEVLDLGAKLRDGTPDSQATLNRAADTLHLSPAALRIFFRILEDRKVAADEASFKLGEIVTCHRAALDRLDLLRASAISETLKEAARTAIAAGDYAEANVALATAGQVNRERAGQHGQTAHSYRSDTADLAFVPALLTLGQFDYLAAARQFMTIASMSTSDRDSAHWFAIWALENQVRTHDDRNALAMAIEVHRTRLRELDRGKDLEGWAKAQVSFGDTLAKLGTRDKAQAAERLEEAVVAYRLAISTVGREAGPTGWAEIQLKLGEALEKLGERGADAARLEEAATAFRLALEEFPRDRELENWERAQLHLGNVLGMLGLETETAAHVREAVAAYRRVADDGLRQRFSQKWAHIQYDIGSTLTWLARLDWEHQIDLRNQAVEAFQLALEEYPRDRRPRDWATLQERIADQWRILDSIVCSLPLREAAIATYRLVLEEPASDLTAETQTRLAASLDSTVARLPQPCGRSSRRP